MSLSIKTYLSVANVFGREVEQLDACARRG
jgi:hypothetical protein